MFVSVNFIDKLRVHNIYVLIVNFFNFPLNV
jgi:hypothetical protein